MTGSGTGSGVSTKLVYVWEDVFKGLDDVDENGKIFSENQLITAFNTRRNIEGLRGYRRRNVICAIPKQFEGTMSVEFTLQNPFWLKALFGEGPDVTPIPETDLFKHEFKFYGVEGELDAVPNKLKSMRFYISVYKLNEDNHYICRGVVINRASIDMSVNEKITVSLDLMIGEIEEVDEDDAPELYKQEDEPICNFYLFSGAKINPFSDRTESIVIERASWEINNNMEMVYGLGSNNPLMAIPKQFDSDLSISAIMSDGKVFSKLLKGEIEIDSPEIELESQNGDKVKVDFQRAYLGDHSTAFRIEDKLVEDCPIITTIPNIVFESFYNGVRYEED